MEGKDRALNNAFAKLDKKLFPSKFLVKNYHKKRKKVLFSLAEQNKKLSFA